MNQRRPRSPHTGSLASERSLRLRCAGSGFGGGRIDALIRESVDAVGKGARTLEVGILLLDFVIERLTDRRADLSEVVRDSKSLNRLALGDAGRFRRTC